MTFKLDFDRIVQRLADLAGVIAYLRQLSELLDRVVDDLHNRTDRADNAAEHAHARIADLEQEFALFKAQVETERRKRGELP